MECDVHANCVNGRCKCRHGYKGSGLRGDCKEGKDKRAGRWPKCHVSRTINHGWSCSSWELKTLLMIYSIYPQWSEIHSFWVTEFVLLFTLIITPALLFKNILIFYQEIFERKIWLTVLWEEFKLINHEVYCPVTCLDAILFIWWNCFSAFLLRKINIYFRFWALCLCVFYFVFFLPFVFSAFTVLVCQTCPLNAVCVDGDCACINGFSMVNNICKLTGGYKPAELQEHHKPFPEKHIYDFQVMSLEIYTL